MKRELLANVDYNKIWLNEMGWNDQSENSRLCNDEVEEAFWEKRAPHYSLTNNLYSGIPIIGKQLLKLIDKDSFVLEIGSGSGNFTIPIAEKASKVLGVEPSKAMIRTSNERVKNTNLKNIEFINCKWEEYIQETIADITVSVNSFYRIKDIELALKKMDLSATKRCIIVRSIIRPKLYELYEGHNIAYRKCNDYIMIPNILWKMGICANINYLPQKCKYTYSSIEEVKNELKQDINEETYLKDGHKLIEAFNNIAVEDTNHQYIYESNVCYTLIWWNKNQIMIL